MLLIPRLRCLKGTSSMHIIHWLETTSRRVIAAMVGRTGQRQISNACQVLRRPMPVRLAQPLMQERVRHKQGDMGIGLFVNTGVFFRITHRVCNTG